MSVHTQEEPNPNNDVYLLCTSLNPKDEGFDHSLTFVRHNLDNEFTFRSNLGLWYNPETKNIEKTYNLSLSEIKLRLEKNQIPLAHFVLNPFIASDRIKAIEKIQAVIDDLFRGKHQDDCLPIIDVSDVEPVPLDRLFSLEQPEKASIELFDWVSLDPRVDLPKNYEIHKGVSTLAQNDEHRIILERNKPDPDSLTLILTSVSSDEELCRISFQDVVTSREIEFDQIVGEYARALTIKFDQCTLLIEVDTQSKLLYASLINSKKETFTYRVFCVGDCDFYSDVEFMQGGLVFEPDLKRYYRITSSELPGSLTPSSEIISIETVIPEARHLKNKEELWVNAFNEQIEAFCSGNVSVHSRALEELVSLVRALPLNLLKQDLLLQVQIKEAISGVTQFLKDNESITYDVRSLSEYNGLTYEIFRRAWLYHQRFVIFSDLNGTLGDFKAGQVDLFNGVINSLRSFLRTSDAYINTGGSFETIKDEFLLINRLFLERDDGTLSEDMPGIGRLNLITRNGMEYWFYNPQKSRFECITLCEGLKTREIQIIQEILKSVPDNFNIEFFNPENGYHHLEGKGPGWYRINQLSIGEDKVEAEKSIVYCPAGRLDEYSRRIFLIDPKNHELLRDIADFLTTKSHEAGITRAQFGRGGETSIDCGTTNKAEAIIKIKNTRLMPYDAIVSIDDQFMRRLSDGRTIEGNGFSTLSVADLVICVGDGELPIEKLKLGAAGFHVTGNGYNFNIASVIQLFSSANEASSVLRKLFPEQYLSYSVTPDLRFPNLEEFN